MLHRRRDKICSILVTSRPVGDAARRAFASAALARRDWRLLALSSEHTGIAVACGFASILSPANVIASQANDYHMSDRRDARTACRQMLF
jgi:hypothetical protein